MDLDAIPKYSRWKNKKTGAVYRVMGFAKNATNAQDGQRLVLYITAKDPEEYVREIGEFLEKFERLT